MTTSHIETLLHDEEAVWAALAAAAYSRKGTVLIAGAYAHQALTDHVVCVALALTNSATGGVCFFGAQPSLVYRDECPQGTERHIQEELSRRIKPRCPRFATFRREGLVALVVESSRDAGCMCLDGAQGRKPAFYGVKAGSVVTRVFDIEEDLRLAGASSLDGELVHGLGPTGVLDPRACAAVGLGPDMLVPGPVPLRFAIELFGSSAVRQSLPGTRFLLSRSSLAEREEVWFGRGADRAGGSYDPPILLFERVEEAMVEWNKGFISDERIARVARELLGNAIGHRVIPGARADGDPPGVSVHVFPDAVRFESLGPPPGGFVWIENGRFVNRWSRNPTIASLLTATGYMEQHGAGFGRVESLLASSDVQVAASVVDGRTVVRLSVGPPPASAAAARPSAIRRRRPTGAGPKKAPKRERTSLAPQIERALCGGPRKISELAEVLCRPRPTVAAAVKKLVAEGRVAATEANPRSPRQRYRLV